MVPNRRVNIFFFNLLVLGMILVIFWFPYWFGNLEKSIKPYTIYFLK
jgi:hypothetical protein